MRVANEATGPTDPRRRRVTVPLFVVLLSGLLGLAGCGDSAPKTIQVRGTVTSGGKPLEGGAIAFQPVEVAPGAPMRPAVGDIAADGTYTLSTYKQGDGAPPGKYLVAITSFIGAPPASTWEESPPKRESRIAPKYNRADTSGLTADVPIDSGGSLTINFDLP